MIDNLITEELTSSGLTGLVQEGFGTVLMMLTFTSNDAHLVYVGAAGAMGLYDLFD